jgi:hypothetical protein
VFDWLFHRASPIADRRKLDRAYVSEFTHFMTDYLADHPEVVADQRAGRSIYWDKKVDLAAQKEATQDAVLDDGYGFQASAWARNSKQ